MTAPDPVLLAMYIAGSVGTTILLVHGTIFRPVRALYKPLLECALCSGSWIGMAAALALLMHDRMPAWLASGIDTMMVAAACAAASYVISVWLHVNNPPLPQDEKKP